MISHLPVLLYILCSEDTRSSLCVSTPNTVCNLRTLLLLTSLPAILTLPLPFATIDHCGKILWPTWVVLPPSTQFNWYYQPDKVGGSLNSVLAYLDRGLPARLTGTYVPAYWDGGLPVRSTGTVHWFAWMGSYQSDQPELCTGLLGWVATGQINQNLFTSLLGWVATSQINQNYVPAYLDGGLPAKSTGTMYQHTYMEVTIHFRWRSCLNLMHKPTIVLHCKYHIAYLIVIQSASGIVTILKKYTLSWHTTPIIDSIPSIWCSRDIYRHAQLHIMNGRNIDHLHCSHVGVPYWSWRSISFFGRIWLSSNLDSATTALSLQWCQQLPRMV